MTESHLRTAPSLPHIIKRRNAKNLSLLLPSRTCHSAPNTPPPLEGLAFKRANRQPLPSINSNLPLVNIQEVSTPLQSTFRRKYSDAGVYYNDYTPSTPGHSNFMIDPTDFKERTPLFEDPYRLGPVKILRNLYLGTEVNARDRTILDRLGIQYILNVAKEVVVPYMDDQIILSPVKEVNEPKTASTISSLMDDEEEQVPRGRRRRRRRRRNTRHGQLRSVSRSDMSSSDVSESWEMDVESEEDVGKMNVLKLKELVNKGRGRNKQHLNVQPAMRVRTPSPLGRSATTLAESSDERDNQHLRTFQQKFSSSTPSLALMDEETSQNKIRVRNPSTESLPGNSTPTFHLFRLDDSGDSEHDALHYAPPSSKKNVRLRYKKFPWGHNQDNLQEYFVQAFRYIDEARSKGIGVLVHCQLGVSRSASMILAYVMRAKRLPLHDAYQYVKERSSIISPNMSLVYQLVEFERTLNLPRPSGEGGARELGQEEGLPQEDE